MRVPYIVLTLVVGALVTVGIFMSRQTETVGDRKAISAHLRSLGEAFQADPTDSRPLDKIRTVLNGEWSFARTYACGVLSELGGLARPAVPDLVRALNCGDGPVEREAARALGDVAIGDPRPVPALMAKLSNEEDDVAWFSAEALGKIGSPAIQAIPALEKASASPNASMRHAAEDALRRLNAAGHSGPEQAN